MEFPLALQMLVLSILLTNAAGIPVLPQNLSEARNWKLPRSVQKPNLALSIDNTFAASFNPKTGEVNLAGGIANGFGLDAGFLTKTHGNSVTFTNGKGNANASGGGSARGDQGSTGFGSVQAHVPSVFDGVAISNGRSLTSAFGPLSHATGNAAGMVD